jgi:hypothetical protein
MSGDEKHVDQTAIDSEVVRDFAYWLERVTHRSPPADPPRHRADDAVAQLSRGGGDRSAG